MITLQEAHRNFRDDRYSDAAIRGSRANRRRKRYLILSRLARHLGVTPAAASQFESGVTRPGTETTQRLAEVLGVPSEFFRLPVTETHEDFFRSLRRTSLSHRRRARAIAHVAHDVALTAEPDQLPAVSIPSLPVAGLKATRTDLEDVARGTVPTGRRWR